MATATGTLYWMTSQGDRPLVHNDPSYMVQFPTAAPPQVSRRDLLDRLAKTHQFDVLIIGGGAHGDRMCPRCCDQGTQCGPC